MILVCVILTIILWFWAIFDITKSRVKNQTTQKIWLLTVLIFPVFGSLVYFQLKRKFIRFETRKFEPKFNKNRI
ncbi:PLDc N-terminal domain-containing protein [Polaribacter sp.]|jgi:hypothetical protein|uniref:PLDc N-terminal domain-containing protein n=1 Tax=Polaribacter sp. TaxID=1920175 RepID=UPI003F4BED34